MSDIETRTDGRLALVTINRPGRGNSVTPQTVTELGDAVRDFAVRDDVDAVVITGTGSVFCAGADVQEMHAVYTSDGADGLMAYLADVWMPAVQATVRALWACPKPVVAALNGAATAGGLDFALTCDRRVAATGARFAESYVNLGMVPVAGGAFLLPLFLGPARAIELLASGRLVGTDEAARIGLVDSICAPEELMSVAAAEAAALARGGALTFARTKAVVRGAHTEALEAALRESYAANVDLIATEPVRRSVIAVMEHHTRR